MSSRTIFITRQHKPYRRLLGSVFRYAVYILPALVSAVLLLVIILLPASVIERFYSQNLFPKIALLSGSISKRLPFSLGGVLLLTLVILAGAAILALPVLLIFNLDRLNILSLYCKALAISLSVILLLFTVTCAPNYYRMTFAEQSGLLLRESRVSELEALCVELIQKTNDQRKLIDDAHVSFSAISQEMLASFNTLSDHYPFIGQVQSPAKAMPFSKILSVFNLTGFYFPYTAEANVNVHMPNTELAFTMSHELAHTAGFMREDEANFIGYLACLQSQDAYVRYSGLFVALNHSMNALYSAEHQRFFELRNLYSPELLTDVQELQDYWAEYFNTPAAEVSNVVNDVYLKANNLSDGLQSYGRMVDLLLAQYRKEHALT